MVIEDLQNSSSYKLARILNILESLHGITVNFDALESIEELEQVYETCKTERQRIIRESLQNDSDEYSKFTMIQEAVRIFLREIAPKRIKRS